LYLQLNVIYILQINILSNNQNDFIKFTDIYPNVFTDVELLYMSNCHHFILGPSTYSWWASYLCKNKDKIIIFPKYWDNKYEGKFDKNLDSFTYINELQEFIQKNDL